MLLPYLVRFFTVCSENHFFTDPKPTKPIKPTFDRLWGFILITLDLHGGLKAQSLSKLVFSEMRRSPMGETNLFTHPEPTKLVKPTFFDLWDLCWIHLNWMVGWKLKVSPKLCFLKCGTHKWGKPTFTDIPNQQKEIKQTSCRLWGFMLDAFELHGGLKADSLKKVGFVIFWFGHHTTVCFS